jgi:hypothetical protein
MLLGWHAQYLEYLQRLDGNLSQPALEVPVFHPAVGDHTSVVVAIPDLASAGVHDLEMESRLSCEGEIQLSLTEEVKWAYSCWYRSLRPGL